MQNKAQNVFRKIVQFFFIAIVSILFISMVFFNNSNINPRTPGLYFLAFIVAFAGFSAFAFLLYKIKQSRISETIKTRWLPVLLCGLAVLTVFQIVLAYNISLPVGWDIGALYRISHYPRGGESYSYLSMYPNNLLLQFFYKILLNIFAILNISNVWFSFSVVNIVAINLALFMLCMFAKRTIGLYYTGLTFITGAFLFAFTPWVSILYSDTFAMPFITGVLLLNSFAHTAKTRKSCILFSLAAGFVLVLGVLIKPTCIIVFIAIFIGGLLVSANKAGTVKHLLICALSASVCLLFLGIYNVFKVKQTFFPFDPNLATPWSHFLMMGSAEVVNNEDKISYGVWNEHDIIFTASFNSTAEKKAATLQAYKERISERGFSRTVKFYYDKLRWLSSDGTFFWGCEGIFQDYTNANYNFLVKLFNRNDPSRSYYNSYRYYAQGLWFSIWSFMLISAVPYKKQKIKPDAYTWQLAILGILFFTMMFEGRSRYLIHYLPVFTLLSSYGMLRAVNFIENKAKPSITKPKPMEEPS